MQAGCHLEKLYAEYTRRLQDLISHRAHVKVPPMPFTSFRVLWGRWIDRYSQGEDSPESWGECFLEHEAGPLV